MIPYRSGSIRAKALMLCVFFVILFTFAPASPVLGSGSSDNAAKAPDFRLPEVSGRSVALHDYRGWVVILDFWASWCGPCRRTMPRFQKWHEDFEFEGLKVLAVNIEGKTDQSLEFLRKTRYTFTVLFDQGNSQSNVAQLYGVRAIPRTIVIDRYGVIRFAGHPSSLSEQFIRQVLKH